MLKVPETHRYHQIQLVLRQRIVDGFYTRNSLIAGERDLATEFSASRVTIRSALAALEREGLIRREQGRGTIVVGLRGEKNPESNEVDAFDILFDSILTMGLRTKVSVLDFRVVQAPDGIASALKIAPKSAVCRLTRVRSLKRYPVSFSVVWMAQDIAHDLSELDLANRPLLTWLRDKGIAIAKTDETLSVCAADIDVASALDLQVGSPLLLVRRVAFDDEDNPVLFFDGKFHPEHYQYRIQLSHVQRTAHVKVQVS